MSDIKLFRLQAGHATELQGDASYLEKRREFDAVYAGTSSYDNAYGTVFIGRFETTEGLLVYKGSSPFWALDSKPGEAFRLVATVKEHADYKGTKQTLIQSPKSLL